MCLGTLLVAGTLLGAGGPGRLRLFSGCRGRRGRVELWLLFILFTEEHSVSDPPLEPRRAAGEAERM